MARWMMLVIPLVFFNISFTEIIQRYKLTDNVGQETSYPFENGNVEIFCNTTDPKDDIPYLRNETSKLKMNFTSFKLEAGLIETAYRCFPAAHVAFKLGLLHCNHFDLIPKMVCKDKQWCMVAKDGHAKCEDINPDHCYMAAPSDMKSKTKFESSLPKLRTACMNSVESDNEENNFGLCQAISSDKQVIGLSDEPLQCSTLRSFTINNSPVVHHQVFVIPVNQKPWEVKYVDFPMSCTLTDSDNTIYGNKSQVKQFSLVPAIKPDQLPKKLKLICAMSPSTDHLNSISAYIIAYDSDPTKYKVEIHKKKSTDGIDLSCSCKVPVGFVCGLSWESMPKTTKGLKDVPDAPMKKVLTAEKHVHDRNYTCYLQVFSYNYPNTFKLILVPLNKKLYASVIVTPKDFIHGANGGKGTEKTGGTDGHGGSRPNAAGGKSGSKPDDKSDKSTIVIIAVVVVVVVVVAVSLALLILLMNRRTTKKRLEKEAKLLALKASDERRAAEGIERKRKDAERKKQALANKALKAKLTFVNSLKDSKTLLDSIFLTLFGRHREAILVNAKTDGTYAFTHVDGMPDFKKVATFWTLLTEVLPTPEALTIPTCRFPALQLEFHSWVFKSTKTPSGMDRFSAPRTLNMSYVTDLYLEKNYILSQAPKISEMDLFLRTLIKEKVTLVVALVERDEFDDVRHNARGRFFDYIEVDLGQSQQHGTCNLKCLKFHESPNYRTRDFEITTNEQNMVPYRFTLVRYLSWQDFAVTEATHVLNLRQYIMDHRAATPGIVLIHCAAGIGRSGALIASMFSIELFEKHNIIDIHSVCVKLRKERIGAIQRFEQYCLIHWVLADYIQREYAAKAPNDKTLRIGVASAVTNPAQKISTRSTVNKKSAKSKETSKLVSSAKM